MTPSSVPILTVTLDLPNRAMVLNMKQYNGKYGFCYRENEGKTAKLPYTQILSTYSMDSVPRYVAPVDHTGCKKRSCRWKSCKFLYKLCK